MQDFQKKAFGYKNVELVGKKLYADTTMNKAQLGALREFFKQLEEQAMESMKADDFKFIQNTKNDDMRNLESKYR